MDKRKKIIIGLGLLLIISIVILVISMMTKPKEEEFKIDGVVFPKYTEILKDQTIGNVKISNISLLTKDGVSTFKARVYNNSNGDLTINRLEMILYENDNEQRVDILREAKIDSGEFTYVNVTSQIDLSKTEKIKFVLE